MVERRPLSSQQLMAVPTVIAGMSERERIVAELRRYQSEVELAITLHSGAAVTVRLSQSTVVEAHGARNDLQKKDSPALPAVFQASTLLCEDQEWMQSRSQSCFAQTLRVKTIAGIVCVGA
eukprot:1444212-Amphidinium_carterae.3